MKWLPVLDNFDDLNSLEQFCSGCHRCPLRENARGVVFGDGNPQARLMFVGEAPGAEEDRLGKPFVGAAGQLLEKIMGAVGLQRSDVYITNINKCLNGYTGIITEEGPKRLNWIVKNKWSGRVLSVGDDGKLLWKKVVGWYRSSLDNRKLVKVSFVNGKNNPKGVVGVIATEDHQFLTTKGWMPARDLTDADLVATGTPYPGPRALQVIIGSLLGDAHISSDNQFLENHCMAQKDYLTLKSRVLSGFKPFLREGKNTCRNKTFDIIQLYLGRTHFFKDLRNLWYEHRHKVFPLSEIEKLDFLGLAIWYLDDGYWRRKNKNGKIRQAIDVEIAVGSISENERKDIVSLFKKMGFQTYFKFHNTWRLNFRYGEGIRFLEKIAKFIPPSMRYKLPEELYSVPFDESCYDAEEVGTYWKNVKVNLLERFPTASRLVYCIDVEDTHCFVTPGGVVHNCRPPGNRIPKRDEADTCFVYLVRQIELIQPRLIVCLGGLATQYLVHKDAKVTAVRGNVYEKGGIKIVPTFHPAAILRDANKKKPVWEDFKKVKEQYDQA